MSATLAAALVEAQREVKSVAKTQPAPGGLRYSYATSESVYGEARRALVSAGLAASLTSSTIYSLDMGGAALLMVRCTFLLEHAASDGRRETVCDMPLVGLNAQKGLDKVLMSAETTRLAYYLRNLLLMQRGDFDEVDSRQEETRRDDTAQADDDDAETPPHVYASRDIAAATTLERLTAIAKKISDTPQIKGAHLEAVRLEWKAKAESLRPRVAP